MTSRPASFTNFAVARMFSSESLQPGMTGILTTTKPGQSEAASALMFPRISSFETPVSSLWRAGSICLMSTKTQSTCSSASKK